MMRAAVYEAYGSPETVTIKEVPKPAVPDDHVLVKTFAGTVNSGDARVRSLNVPRGMTLLARVKLGWFKPKQPILGFEIAGEIQEVGRTVTQFQPGDRVVASRGFDFGCHAEYVSVPESGAIANIPQSVSYEDAVAVCFGGMTALHFFRLGHLASGETLLINGASGAVGTMAVQLAKHLGAEVTAVCSGANADLVKNIGADHIIDYTKEDFTRNGRQYDVIMDTHGNAGYARIKNSLTPNGRFLMVIGDLLQTVAGTINKAVVTGNEGKPPFNAEVYGTLTEQGAIKPVIDATLPFEQIVDAYRRVDSGHKVGSVVLTFGRSH